MTLAIVQACGGSDEPPPEETSTGDEVVAEPEPEPEPPPPAPSPLRVLHAAAASFGAAVSGMAGDAQIEEVAFAAASAYVPVDVGSTLALNAGGATVEQALELSPGVPVTALLFSGEGGAPTVLVMPDEARPVMGQTRGRFVNAMLGSGEALDLCFPGANRRAPGRALIAGVEYGDFGGIPSFPSRYQPMTLAGVDAVQVRVAAENACSGAIVGTAALPPIDINVAHNLTIVAIGRRTGRPAVPRQLLVCEDTPGPGTCVALPLR
ncbi:MAG: DUF4397 domain-containing protein [Sandaracinaceae bacterium]|nr:DUF4397 domain-containing protein [Sandaracinaceae bacterium]